MPRLGPSGGGGGNRKPAEVVEPGQHVIVLRWFKRKQTQDDRDYFSGLFEIVSLPGRGKCFWAMRSLDFDKESTVKFWQSYIDSVGCREEIELGDSRENTDGAGDANIRRVFRGKPVVAEVIQESENGFTGNKIKFLVFPSKWTDEQRRWAQEFLDKGGGQRDPAEDAGPPPEDDGYIPRDEDAPPARGRQRAAEADDYGPRDAYPRGGGYGDEDDDIPF